MSYTEYFKGKECTEKNCIGFHKDRCACVSQSYLDKEIKKIEKGYKWIDKLGVNHYNSNNQNIEIILIDGKECFISVKKAAYSTVTFRMRGSRIWQTVSKKKFTNRLKEVSNGRK